VTSAKWIALPENIPELESFADVAAILRNEFRYVNHGPRLHSPVYRVVLNNAERINPEVLDSQRPSQPNNILKGPWDWCPWDFQLVALIIGRRCSQCLVRTPCMAEAEVGTNFPRRFNEPDVIEVHDIHHPSWSRTRQAGKLAGMLSRTSTNSLENLPFGFRHSGPTY